MDGIAFDLSPIDWAGISGIADVLLVVLNVVLIASLIIGYRGIREAATARNADMLVWAISQIEEVKSELGVLYEAPDYVQQLTGTRADGAGWSDRERDAAYRVSIRLQRLAYLARSGMISKEHLIEMWAPTFVRSWEKLEPWVKDLRLSNGEPVAVEDGGFSRKDFELFARDCRDFHDRLVSGRTMQETSGDPSAGEF